jgi:hypothetical protein
MVDQKSKWHDTRKARLDELFTGRKFRIVEEFKFDEPVATPLGYKVKSGYRIEQVDSTDGEVAEYFIGKSLLNTLANDYAAVDKPEPKRRGRPRKDPLERAEAWAARKLPGDASPLTQPGPAQVNPNASEEFRG